MPSAGEPPPARGGAESLRAAVDSLPTAADSLPTAADSLRATLRVVAITDRRLMVPEALLAAGDWPAIARVFGQAIARAVSGCPSGSVVVQVREKDLDGGPLLQLVRAAQPFAPVIVNDRLDVALAASAHGVHLPERGISLADACALAPNLVIGVSRHAPPLDTGAPDLVIGVSRHAPPLDAGATAATAAIAAAAADLVQLGPIWPTPSKPTATPLSEAALAWPHGAALLVAVGGIDTPERAQLASAAGADAVAVIRAAWSGASLTPYVAAVNSGLTRRSPSSGPPPR